MNINALLNKMHISETHVSTFWYYSLTVSILMSFKDDKEND